VTAYCILAKISHYQFKFWHHYTSKLIRCNAFRIYTST